MLWVLLDFRHFDPIPHLTGNTHCMHKKIDLRGFESRLPVCQARVHPIFFDSFLSCVDFRREVGDRDDEDEWLA